ncbi:hypothetical protein [Sphingobacterium multivorum]|uniref:hypothetical protein n=1 Tax=Sphingobacterium multivorum TaxID=28454 RepID=UPI00301A481D
MKIKMKYICLTALFAVATYGLKLADNKKKGALKNQEVKNELSKKTIKKEINTLDTIFVDDISALRNLPSPSNNNTKVVLRNYYKKGDLPFNITYSWDENLNNLDNNGNFIKTKKSQKGRFYYDLSDTVTVAQFGIFPGDKFITTRLNELAKLLASKNKVLSFDKGTYWIQSDQQPPLNKSSNNLNKKGFIIPSNSKIYTHKNTFFQSIPTKSSNYSVICIHYAHNIKINSLNIIGDRGAHLGRTGEWGHGLFVVGSKSIQIENLNTSNCWGDGVVFSGDGELAGSSLKGQNEDIQIGNLTSFKNRRQGLTISNARNLSIDNIDISDISGVAPECGIDFEPDYNYDILENIVLKNVTTKNCANSGIIFSLQALSKASKQIAVTILKYKSFGERSFFIGGALEEYIKGTIKINDFKSYSSPLAAIEIRDYFNQPDLLFGNVQIFNPNGKKREDFYGSGILIYKDIDDQNNIIDKVSPKIVFDNLLIEDNKANRTMQHGIFIQNRISPSENFKNITIKKRRIKGNKLSEYIGL